MDLQETFYAMGIIYMAITFALMIAAVVAILVIKHKVHAIQQNLEDKLQTLITIVRTGEALVEKTKNVFGRNK